MAWGGWLAGREYQARIRASQSGSPRASARRSSAAAANSHSYQVGNRACSLAQKAWAACQLTWVTGASACSGANASGPAHNAR
ncbi:hypothetical protein D3C86_1983400 [compost metagenome]